MLILFNTSLVRLSANMMMMMKLNKVHCSYLIVQIFNFILIYTSFLYKKIKPPKIGGFYYHLIKAKLRFKINFTHT